MTTVIVIAILAIVALAALRGLLDAALEALFPSRLGEVGFEIQAKGSNSEEEILWVSLTVNPYLEAPSGAALKDGCGFVSQRETFEAQSSRVEVCFVHIFDPRREDWIFSLEEQVKTWRALDRSLTQRGKVKGEPEVRARYKHYRNLLREVREGQETP